MIVEIRVYSYFLKNVFLRYRQVVTLKRTYIVVAITWIKSTFVAALYPVDFRITIFLWLYSDTIMRNCFVCVVYKNFLGAQTS